MKAFNPEGRVEITEKQPTYSVERKFSVIHYEPHWPPWEQREQGVKPENKSHFMSELMNKKIIRELREAISVKLFTSIDEIKGYIYDFVVPRVTEEDFGEMALVKPTLKVRVGKGKKFIEIRVQWLDPNKDKIEKTPETPSWMTSHLNDPWFAIRVIEKQ